jgi:hypothetical protein
MIPVVIAPRKVKNTGYLLSAFAVSLLIAQPILQVDYAQAQVSFKEQADKDNQAFLEAIDKVLLEKGSVAEQMAARRKYAERLYATKHCLQLV